ncbi:MAG: hypothetical protein JSV80_01125 [Acidobacteriota bacterium]|nr:MAG: hypothetical protein JSV80_01125 [Acidobacteriota bacterium]
MAFRKKAVRAVGWFVVLSALLFLSAQGILAESPYKYSDSDGEIIDFKLLFHHYQMAYYVTSLQVDEAFPRLPDLEPVGALPTPLPTHPGNVPSIVRSQDLAESGGLGSGASALGSSVPLMNSAPGVVRPPKSAEVQSELDRLKSSLELE